MLMLCFLLCCVLATESASVLADTDGPVYRQLSSLDMVPSDPLANDARQAYRSASYLQALRLSRDVLARHPSNHTALLVMLKSMSKLGMTGQMADAAISYAERYHPYSATINTAISQMYLAQGNLRKASDYKQLARRQHCAFNCQQ